MAKTSPENQIWPMIPAAASFHSASSFITVSATRKPFGSQEGILWSTNLNVTPWPRYLKATFFGLSIAHISKIGNKTTIHIPINNLFQLVLCGKLSASSIWVHQLAAWQANSLW
ncbi:MAG: hypothetical protein LBJ38_03500 [Oscillospiraceae bacterium]|jgi:hypothetical protein|nr:hypothetical protein [Oscillospiraceae bacterium]